MKNNKIKLLSVLIMFILLTVGCNSKANIEEKPNDDNKINYETLGICPEIQNKVKEVIMPNFISSVNTWKLDKFIDDTVNSKYIVLTEDGNIYQIIDSNEAKYSNGTTCKKIEQNYKINKLVSTMDSYLAITADNKVIYLSLSDEYLFSYDVTNKVGNPEEINTFVSDGDGMVYVLNKNGKLFYFSSHDLFPDREWKKYYISIPNEIKDKSFNIHKSLTNEYALYIVDDEDVILGKISTGGVHGNIEILNYGYSLTDINYISNLNQSYYALDTNNNIYAKTNTSSNFELIFDSNLADEKVIRFYGNVIITDKSVYINKLNTKKYLDDNDTYELIDIKEKFDNVDRLIRSNIYEFEFQYLDDYNYRLNGVMVEKGNIIKYYKH